jgi:hypothetical protein
VLIQVRGLLEAAGPSLIGPVAFVAIVVVVVFVFCTGLAVVVALFHRDEKTRRDAIEVLRQLLGLFTRRGGR